MCNQYALVTLKKKNDFQFVVETIFGHTFISNHVKLNDMY